MEIKGQSSYLYRVENRSDDTGELPPAAERERERVTGTAMVLKVDRGVVVHYAPTQYLLLLTTPSYIVEVVHYALIDNYSHYQFKHKDDHFLQSQCNSTRMWSVVPR
ncbi:hypothetical protein C1H46_035229 [Malus baccata]|uniref:Uncharacterized protein n=1 Tax=Malus baccata TaxID=106549 RepID=A0A540KY92_MALBA|nr:hypothetical protein C1H46_035229 [Malus baccata]